MIRSDTIRINLAHVGPGEPIATYIDDQPIALHAADESCCLVFSVKGYITPGVHTLTVRNVGCSDSCSITSQPSNEVRFHYYEEDVYLLRPGGGCDNVAQSGANCRRASDEEGSPDTKESSEEDQPGGPEPAPNPSQLPSPVIDAAAERANSPQYYASVGKDGLAELQDKLEAAWDYAEAAARQASLRTRIDRASKSKNDVDVQRANDWANVTEIRASREEAKAEARIKTARAENRVAAAAANANIVAGELNARAALAKRVRGPSSPFYFASAAHFPLPRFGPKGRLIDSEGLLIYEDMKFSFDRDGNYEVHFRATTPEMPTTVKLQFQIQPCQGGPWYTVTLAPIQFKYSPNDAQQQPGTACGGDDCNESDHPCVGEDPCCGKTRDCICRGHSEILRRCYAELGQNARIRRHGTARFGFGVDVP